MSLRDWRRFGVVVKLLALSTPPIQKSFAELDHIFLAAHTAHPANFLFIDKIKHPPVEHRRMQLAPLFAEDY